MGGLSAPSQTATDRRRTLRAMLADPAVRVEREVMDVADLILLGLLGGEWPALEESIMLALDVQAAGACPVSDAEVRARATAFRYGRRLVSAADFSMWLHERQLRPDDLAGVFARAVAREAFLRGPGSARPGEAAAEPDCVRPGDLAAGGRPRRRATQAELEPILRAEALCEGTLEAMAGRGVHLLAAADRLGAMDTVGPDDVRVTMALADAREARATGLPGLGEDELIERLCALVGLAQGRSRLLAEVVAPDQVARRIADHGLQWLRLSGQELTVGREGAAREARLLLSEDRLPIAEVAARAGSRVAPFDAYLDTLPEGLMPVFATAAPGEVVGPWQGGAPGDGCWHVLLVSAKVPPSPDDPVLFDRAAEAILTEMLDRHAAGRAERLRVL